MSTEAMYGNHPMGTARRDDFHSKVRLTWPEATGTVGVVTTTRMSKNARRKAKRYVGN